MPARVGVEDDDEEEESGDGIAISHSRDTHDQEKTFLFSRVFPLPTGYRNCYVEVYTNSHYDEHLYFRAVDARTKKHRLCERSISIDDAHELLDSAQGKPEEQLNREDLETLRATLINMFKEADTYSHGYLSYEEFQGLMEKVDVGITTDELRLVIAEADEDDNGYIDYHEFVPLAVDMIQAFMARTRAKSMHARTDVHVDDEVLHMLSNEELNNIFQSLSSRLNEVDPQQTKRIKINDFKKILEDEKGLIDSEKRLIAYNLPRDKFGQFKSDTLKAVLFEVRFASMKAQILETQADDMTKHLFELCHEEELKMKGIHKEGMLPLKSLIKLMVESQRLKLNRLQVMVITSEAEVVDGLVDYHQFIPLASKTIELMFEPKALKQRAELIETSDLSPEALLSGLSPEVFRARLAALFKACDMDKNNVLDMKEFRACLESLDLRLNPNEISALMASAGQRVTHSVPFLPCLFLQTQ